MTSPPPLDADLIMKGGITSGIVYPKAILALHSKYRLRNIGGTSAGAIAAVLAAAAEYGRDRGGFDKLGKIPDEMSTHIVDLFQPVPAASSYFQMFRAVLDHHWLKLLGHLWWMGRFGTLFGFLLGLAPFWLPGVFGHYWWSGLSCWGQILTGLGLLLVTLLSMTLMGGVAAMRRLAALLPSLDFGLCPGTSQANHSFPALSHWLNQKINELSDWDEDKNLRPLTFGDLKKPPGEERVPITLRTMTTNLNMRRPHTLPNLGDENFYFSEREFRRLLPDSVVDYMVRVGRAALEAREAELKRAGKHFIWPSFPAGDGPQTERLFRFPKPDELPILVGARMSLSFPVLISTVPLYRIDFDYVPESGMSQSEIKPMRRLLFSDGGLSSNFPIHFFDSLLPSHPTFGISLDDYSEDRPSRQVHLPMQAADGQWIGIKPPFTSLGAFAMGLVNAAKDWQDQLRGVLPGYRERVGHVFLKPNEGGLNLTMPPQTVATLVDLGDRAGQLMIAATGANPNDKDKFDFDDHRWRRYLVLYAALEEALLEASDNWGDISKSDSFAAFISAYQTSPGSYKNSTLGKRQEIFDRMSALMALAQTWKTGAGPIRQEPNLIPRPGAHLRITPDY